MNTELILIFAAVFTFIIGTVIGSFLNVVALRGLTGESIVLPPSKCPHCKNKLKPWHNIPILSYLFLGGKCAFCKEKISMQYPIVELLTGLLAVGTLFKFGPSFTAAFVFVVFCILLVMSVTDIKEKVICAGHAWFMIIFGLLYNIFLTWFTVQTSLSETGAFLFTQKNLWGLPIVNSVLGVVAGVVIMEILANFGRLFAGKRAFGVGDTYIAAGLGICFGIHNLLVMIPISIVVQLAFVLPGFLKKLACKGDYHTVISLILFLLATGAFSVCNYSLGLFENTVVLIAASVVLGIIGLYTCVRIIKGIKDGNELTVLPFGPAMAIAAVITMLLLTGVSA